jgi:hypothetical protein
MFVYLHVSTGIYHDYFVYLVWKKWYIQLINMLTNYNYRVRQWIGRFYNTVFFLVRQQWGGCRYRHIAANIKSVLFATERWIPNSVWNSR